MLWVGFGLLLVEFGLVWGRLDLGLAPCGFPLDRIRFDLGSLGFGFVLGLLWVGFGWVEFALGWPYVSCMRQGAREAVGFHGFPVGFLTGM